MKFQYASIISAIIVCLCLPGPGHAGSSLSHGQSWKFIEAVGGIAIGNAFRTPKGTAYLPIECDVSGLTEITKKPRLLNSAIVVSKISAEVRDKEILISVHTGLVGSKSKCTCDGVEMNDIPAETYEVFYYGSDREKHLIGTAIIPGR